MYQVIGKLVI